MKRGTPGHPKIAHLAQLLGVERWAALGMVEALVHWAMKYAIQGDIGRWSNETIAEGVGYGGDADRMVEALLEARWLDPHPKHRLLIHDWHDHADTSVRKTLKNRDLDFLTRLDTPFSGKVRNVSGKVRNDSGKVAPVTGKERKGKERKGKERPGEGERSDGVLIDVGEAPKTPRPPDPIWDGVCDIFWPTGVPESQRKRVGRIVQDLKELGATPQTIRWKVEHMRHSWQTGATVTPEALVKHWGSFPGLYRSSAGQLWTLDGAFVLDDDGRGPEWYRDQGFDLPPLPTKHPARSTLCETEYEP